ncbi:MAG: carbohydrate ABC transporter permease [Lachnospiraceae bacterium]|nr:carbohydrate ABC transporter permease [Lachnospiraceae bacterium]
MNTSLKKLEQKRKIQKAILYVLLTICAAYTLFPLLFLFVNSFKGQAEIVKSPISLPKKWSFEYLATAWDKVNIVSGLINTLIITVSAVALIVIISSLAAWVMVRSKSKFSTILFLGFTSAMLIPFQSVMYPLLSIFENLGLKNTFGLILMYGGFGLSMSVFLYHGFLKSVPKSLEEAAVIDGANIFQLFFKIVFPLVKSTTVTVIILNSMWIWNDYLLPFLVIGNNNTGRTLTLELYFAKMQSGQFGNPWELIFPAVFIAMIPIIVLFLFLQKHIVRGVADGAVKG